ncbi:hypothetical protein HanXRQr2_Chr15g0699671 [Helianthus annuus]|uniref:Uncharacterized protein n=1 Tax=Helianthus annuus TaxID=4232 RepID=A0A9K3E136_HELAN|nr:hypothetical protein HanXRQr2_Chr15g0699671 [Helianthus annuus]KAJ0831804.1 hypothetical protein HanPSC8_Chr15g0671361 [Helianthus annuus]
MKGRSGGDVYGAYGSYSYGRGGSVGYLHNLLSQGFKAHPCF